MAKKNKSAFDIMTSGENSIDVPYHVWTLFGENAKTIELAGDQASIGCDYKNLTQVRAALQWLAHQFGGHITWKNPDEEK